MKKLPVFIPSYGRPGRVTTLAMLPKHASPILCVRREQVDEYRAAYPDILIRVIPDRYPGIAGARVWICRYALSRKYRVIAMLDDDMIGGWFTKTDPSRFGGLARATPREVEARWKFHHKRALSSRFARQGYAISMSDRRVLAYGKSNPRGHQIHHGLVGRCVLLNTVAMQKAQFTINACEDVESTLAWLIAGVFTGQDIHFGHGGHKEWATTKDAGGVGALRERQQNIKTKNHRRLMRIFPECVGYTSTGKERTSYHTAAKLGGLLDAR